MLITPIKPAQGENAWDNTISSQSSNDTSAPSELDHSDDGSSSSSSSSPISSPKTPPSSEYNLSIDHSSSDSMSRDEELPALITRVMTKGVYYLFTNHHWVFCMVERPFAVIKIIRIIIFKSCIQSLINLLYLIFSSVFNQMMMPGGADEECYRLFLQLLDDTANHEVCSLV